MNHVDGSPDWLMAGATKVMRQLHQITTQKMVCLLYDFLPYFIQLLKHYFFVSSEGGRERLHFVETLIFSLIPDMSLRK
jgi:hypothetical protein